MVAVLHGFERLVASVGDCTAYLETVTEIVTGCSSAPPTGWASSTAEAADIAAAGGENFLVRVMVRLRVYVSERVISLGGHPSFCKHMLLQTPMPVLDAGD